MKELVPRVGQIAGRVWRLLNSEGELSIASLSRRLDERTQSVVMAVGWLAREGKITLRIKGTTTLVSLKENAQSW
jgi:hypothetical protein